MWGKPKLKVDGGRLKQSSAPMGKANYDVSLPARWKGLRV